MNILTIRTDKPEAEIRLFSDNTLLAEQVWVAHRQLAETIHQTIKTLMDNHNLDWANVEGIVFYKGPGSFTGLRIGASVANALAHANHIPIVARTADDWQQTGIEALLHGQHEGDALPEYGSDAHVTAPKK